MNLGFEYIKYRWNAKGRHGIHSPYVYDLLDKCLTIKLKQKDTKALNRLFRSLNNNHSVIEIEDFGAGSKKLGNKRSVQSIFKTSSSRGKYGKLLYQLSHYFQLNHVLEFGTSLGTGSSYLQLGNPKAKITTVEACRNTRNEALKNFKLLNLLSIRSIHATFDEYLAQGDDTIFDLIFIDGHHDGKATIRYMENLLKNTREETIFIFDDIRWSDDMFNAWKQIVASSKFHVTIDFFRFGIAVPRTYQEKEHFTLKL